MGGNSMIRGRIKASPGAAGAVRRIVAAWRRLSGGRGVPDSDRRTLAACSGGADSLALVLALASATEQLVVGHVRHDLRDSASVDADRDVAEALARALGLAFVEGRARVREMPGNAEGNARRVRYAELARMAREGGCALVATAHHADDQLETLLMRLMRGAGPKGLGGVAPRRRLHEAGATGDASERNSGVVLIRPMLGVTRAEAELICRACGVAWREDATNADTSRLRAYVRREVAPLMRARSPGVSVRAARSAELLRGAARCVEARSRGILRTPAREAMGVAYSRARLRREPAVVIGAWLRRVHTELARGGNDRLSSRSIAGVARAIRSTSTEPREFSIGGLVVLVRAREVELRAR